MSIIQEKRPLFAIAFILKGASIQFEYLHAENVNHARIQFCAAHPNRVKFHIIDIAPAVGYYVHDNHGDVLSV